MKRMFAILSVAVVLAVTAFAQPSLSAKAGCTGCPACCPACCADKCADCSQGGCKGCSDCCPGCCQSK